MITQIVQDDIEKIFAGIAASEKDQNVITVEKSDSMNGTKVFKFFIDGEEVAILTAISSSYYTISKLVGYRGDIDYTKVIIAGMFKQFANKQINLD